MSEVRSASLYELGEGSGEFIGENKDVVMSNFRFLTGHQFTRKSGEAAGEPATVCVVDITVEEPDDDEHARTTQYYAVGDPEHFQASADNKTPGKEGGYIVLTGTYDNIW